MQGRSNHSLTFSYNQILGASFVYLILPFLIFCVGFLKIYISIPAVALFIWLAYRYKRTESSDERFVTFPVKTIALAVGLTLLWVWLSGIGGFAFQNTDFHTRNAIFRDLITHEWPVRYYSDTVNPTNPYYLIYYIGFWLPAALVGKLGGWLAANIALFLWSVIGILLAVLLVSIRVKLSAPKLLLLFVFFSGMDALGVVIKLAVLPGIANPLWPPIYHLEWWITYLQYSSFTTQLFWVFNQAIPAWICMVLLLTLRERKLLLLTWALSCFFSPLIAIGMFPYLLLKMPDKLLDAEHLEKINGVKTTADFWRLLWEDLKALLSLENVLGGGLVLIVSLLYYASNTQTGVKADATTNDYHFWIGLFIFLLMEGGGLWAVFSKSNRKNLLWYLAGLLLVTIPLIRIGSAHDFCMRASIPTLFMLLVWSAEELAKPRSATRTFVIILLCIGAITPLFEINRSVYRTSEYFLNPPSTAEKLEGQQMKIYDPNNIEYDHPYTLVADSFKSLDNFEPAVVFNFLAKINDNSFSQTLLK